jgi:hypothetical protein
MFCREEWLRGTRVEQSERHRAGNPEGYDVIYDECPEKGGTMKPVLFDEGASVRDRLDGLENLKSELKRLFIYAQAALDATDDRDELSGAELNACNADIETIWKGLKRLREITDRTIDWHRFFSSH